MGLRHMKNRTLQVVWDAPVAGIHHVTSGMGSAARSRRRQQIDAHVAEKKLQKDIEAQRWETIYEAEKALLMEKRDKERAERDARVQEEVARLKAQQIIAAERARVQAEEAMRKAKEAELARQAEAERRAFEDLERKEQAARAMLAEVSEERSRMSASSKLGASKAADEPAPLPEKAAEPETKTTSRSRKAKEPVDVKMEA